MNCTRCEISGGQSTDTSIDEGSHSDEEDIGGFAGISDCLHKLKNSEKQVGTPLEEDLASWGHHFSPNTVPDTIFQASAGDEVILDSNITLVLVASRFAMVELQS